MITDIELVKTKAGYYDFEIENGDFKITHTLDTAMVMSLFGNVRADPTEVVVPQNRNGWWGNLYSSIPGYQYGSKWWLLYQARNTQNTLNSGVAYTRNCFAWLIEDGYATQIRVNGSWAVSGIQLDVKIITLGGSLLARTYLVPRSL